jgi:hypothetical protein
VRTPLASLTLFLAIALATVVPSAAPSFSGAQPQLAAAGNRVYLAFGSGDAIRVARSDDRGATFGAAATLPAGGKLSLGRHRGPRIVSTDAAVLVTAIAGVKGGGADGDVVLFRSTDHGATWQRTAVINDVPGSAREGLHGMAATPDGLVAVAWLDLREKGTRVYAAVSRDHGATWSPDTLVHASLSGSVCECCHPSVAIRGDGQIAVMFRNQLNGNRDMYVARAGVDGKFGEAAKLGTSSWLLNACPMDGGGFSFSPNGFAAAWRRDDGIFLSTGEVAERRLGTGRDAALAVSGAHHDVAWTGSTGILLVRDNGRATTIAPGQFPALVALQDRTILAWEDRGTVHVQVIPR